MPSTWHELLYTGHRLVYPVMHQLCFESIIPYLWGSLGCLDLIGAFFFGDSSGILYTWTGSGKIVRTSMYWYVPVCTSTYQYTKSRPVHTGTY